MLKLNGKTHHTEQKHIVIIILMFYFLDYECPEPTSILHASYVRTGADAAEYTCDPFYLFSNNGNSMTLTCNQNFTWEQINDVCRRQGTKLLVDGS